MTLEENQNLANVSRRPATNLPSNPVSPPGFTSKSKSVESIQMNVLQVRSPSQSGTPRGLRLRTWKLDSGTLCEAPQLTLDVETPLNVVQMNGLFKEQSPSPARQRNTSIRLASSPIVRNGLLSRSEQSPSPEPTGWSAAIGHASTGKSGRVIERLQGDIDRLHREKLLVKVRLDEAEKANETLSTRNQQLRDRNSNFEQSHEANTRHIARKDRQLDELREELKREKVKTAKAQAIAEVAVTSEEQWRDQANMARSIASRKETEYEVIVACRKRDNDRNQGALIRIKQDLEVLLRQREDDIEKHRKLAIIAEQQRQTIGHLDELTKRLATNFKSYKTEIDTAIAGLRAHARLNDTAMMDKLEEMDRVTGEMRWIMNVDETINHRAGGPSVLSSRN